jgi:hypothetical protein
MNELLVMLDFPALGKRKPQFSFAVTPAEMAEVIRIGTLVGRLPGFVAKELFHRGLRMYRKDRRAWDDDQDDLTPRTLRNPQPPVYIEQASEQHDVHESNPNEGESPHAKNAKRPRPGQSVTK